MFVYICIHLYRFVSVGFERVPFERLPFRELDSKSYSQTNVALRKIHEFSRGPEQNSGISEEKT